MKNELCVKGFSAVTENEMLDVDGGVVSGTLAIVLGAIGITAGATALIASFGKSFGWW